MSSYCLVTHHTTSLHITRQVKKYVKNSNTGEEKNRNKNRTKLIISKSKRAKFWAQNYGWWKVLDVSKSVFLCVSVDDWTKASKQNLKYASDMCVCESNRIFISFVWCRSFCPEIMILMITSTAQKNEKFPRNLYKFIEKIKKKCHINCGFDFSSFPHFYTFRFCCFVYVRDVFSPPVSYVCVFLCAQATNEFLLFASGFSVLVICLQPMRMCIPFREERKKRILIGVSRLKKVMKMWEIF